MRLPLRHATFLAMLLSNQRLLAEPEAAREARIVIVSPKSLGSHEQLFPPWSQGWLRLIDVAEQAYSYRLSQDPAAPHEVTPQEILAISGADFVFRPSAKQGFNELCSADRIVAEVKGDAPSMERPNETVLALTEALGYQAIVERIDGKFAVVAGYLGTLRQGAQGLVLGASASHLVLKGLDLTPKGIVDVRSVENGRARVAYAPLPGGLDLVVGDKILFRVDP